MNGNPNLSVPVFIVECVQLKGVCFRWKWKILIQRLAGQRLMYPLRVLYVFNGALQRGQT